GERMRPFTENTPKPLLEAGGKPLLQWNVENLVAAGFRDLVINVSHLAEQIEAFLGDGSRWNCRVTYSREAQPLEAAGGIIQALPLLGDEPFALVNADIWSDYPLQRLALQRVLPAALGVQRLAHLVLVDNPPQHQQGDFVLEAEGQVRLKRSRRVETLTYTGIAVYHPQFFAGTRPGKQALLPLLERAMASDQVGGEHYRGNWTDVGTPQRLQELDARLGLL
ncbi:MAG: N-acetylmuramate alpha-1-phosphate uridylyltransferase MurU, partial [Lysobacterales bacterium]